MKEHQCWFKQLLRPCTTAMCVTSLLLGMQVVSLWNVNDKATADLITKFYEKMLKQGARPAALRAAQVEMWKQKQWQSPYYWAAFTTQGEWK
jgi:CHAT domain-containing protein